MCVVRLIGRILLLLAVFLGVGLWTGQALIAHAVAAGTPEYEVRLAGAMGGLFAGGGATALTGLALLLARPRRRTPEDPRRPDPLQPEPRRPEPDS